MTHTFTVDADLDVVARALQSIGTVVLDRVDTGTASGALAGGGEVGIHPAGLHRVEVVLGHPDRLAACELADLLSAYLGCAVTPPVPSGLQPRPVPGC